MHQPVHLLGLPHAGHESRAQRASKDRPTRKWWALAVLCMGMLLSALDMTVVNLALPSLATDLNANTTDLEWIVDAYTIVLAGMLLFANGLADRFGRRRAFVGGMTLFAIATTTSAFSQSAAQLIASRALAGLGAAFILPPALSTVAVIFEPAERGRAIGYWSMVGTSGLALGPIVGGLLLGRFWWGSVFLVTVPVCIVAVIGGVLFLPESVKPELDRHSQPPGSVPPVDLAGGVLSIVGLSVFFYGVIEGPRQGWNDPATLTALVVGGIVIAAFVVRELRAAHPMFDVRVFAIGPVLAGGMTLFVLYTNFMGMLFLVPQYLEFIAGHSPVVSGFYLMPITVAMAVGATQGPRVAARFGSARTIDTCLAVIAAGMLVPVLFESAAGFASVVGGGFVAGLAIGIAMAPSSTVVMNALPVAKAGEGGAVNQLTRQVGGVAGTALVGSAFASMYRHSIADSVREFGAQLSVSAEQTFPDTIAAAQAQGRAPGTAIRQAATEAFTNGARAGFLVAATIALIGLVVARRAFARADTPIDAVRGEPIVDGV